MATAPSRGGAPWPLAMRGQAMLGVVLLALVPCASAFQMSSVRTLYAHTTWRSRVLAHDASGSCCCARQVISAGIIMSSASAQKIDVAVIGAGIGGLVAAATLASCYEQRVHVFESHYRAGGCAHSFPIKSKQGATYLFDAGPTIIAGCSRAPYNPLQQMLQRVGAADQIHYRDYRSWGMVDEHGHWNFVLGTGKGAFAAADGPLARFGGPNAIKEFNALRAACAPLCAGAAAIPTMSLRDDAFKLLPLLPHLKALQKVLPYATTLEGSFEGLMNAHVRDPWLRSWLDALAFSLSGLPAAQTGAAAMAYTLFDLHKEGACLDYPVGGMGRIADVLVDTIRQNGGEVHLSSPVEQIVVENGRAVGVNVRLRRGAETFVRARKGVICNANCWALPSRLLSTTLARGAESAAGLSPSQTEELRSLGDVKVTKSFLHLHLGLDVSGLELKRMQPHFTVMDQGLHTSTDGSGSPADPCGDRNMVAVSNPSVLDDSLVDTPDRAIVHAYGAGNEPYETWASFVAGGAGAATATADFATDSPPDSVADSTTDTEKLAITDGAGYVQKREAEADFLWRSVGAALGLSVAEVRERAEVAMVGTPLTHQRFNRRFKGTYGPTFRDTLQGPNTPIPGLYLAGDSTFPGIGVPAVAVSGAQAANTMVSPLAHLLQILN